MSTPIIAFFNNKSRVGRTALVYHLSWMYVELGLRVVVADLDPQAGLTTALLDEDRLEELWPRGDHPSTIYGCIQPLVQGTGDIAEPHLEQVELERVRLEDMPPSVFRSPLALLVGDLFLSSFEDELAEAWLKCLQQDERSFHVMSAFWRIIQRAATEHKADVVLIDVGPNVGAINRAALIAADFVVVPLATDLFSLQGLRNLGPTLHKWRDAWKERIMRSTVSDVLLPQGEMRPVGYTVLQHPIRLDRAYLAYGRWIVPIPDEYREFVLHEAADDMITVNNDPYCLAHFKHYFGLMPLAEEARKPMFLLKPADGTTGVYAKAVPEVYAHFRSLAQKIAQRTNIPLHPPFTQ
jgi:cellulose biosynthesis protein BcsQ